MRIPTTASEIQVSIGSLLGVVSAVLVASHSAWVIGAAAGVGAVLTACALCRVPGSRVLGGAAGGLLIGLWVFVLAGEAHAPRFTASLNLSPVVPAVAAFAGPLLAAAFYFIARR